MNKKLAVIAVVGAALGLLQGCAPSSYAVDPPEASQYVFIPAGAEVPHRLNFVDGRDDTYTPFTSGVLAMGLTSDGAEIQPIAFIERFTRAELTARGINMDSGDSAEVRIVKFNMRNYRTTAFSPFTTVTLLSGDIMTSRGSQRVGSFVMRGKVPVWSFNEVIEPTMNQPLEIVVDDLASKINMHVYGESVSDADVDRLASAVRAEPDRDDAYLDVYQLGFSNNPKAVGPLVEFVDSPHEYIRLAAISGLGSINASDHVDLLTAIFRGEHGAGRWQDKAMAIKSLCDLAVMGNDEAMAFVRNDVEAEIAGETAIGVQWIREILGLYLRS